MLLVIVVVVSIFVVVSDEFEGFAGTVLFVIVIMVWFINVLGTVNVSFYGIEEK